MEDPLGELEKRKLFVHDNDNTVRSRNREQFKSYWLHMTILSSAIVVGVLPLFDKPQIVLSLTLVKAGLLLIISVCVLVVLYLHSVLSREKKLLADQNEIHNITFSIQRQMLEEAQRGGKSKEFIRDLFETTKGASYHAEQDIIANHLVKRRFFTIKHFIDGYFNSLIAYGFALGVLLVILSFIVREEFLQTLFKF